MKNYKMIIVIALVSFLSISFQSCTADELPEQHEIQQTGNTTKTDGVKS
jgi:hypothetical protein